MLTGPLLVALAVLAGLALLSFGAAAWRLRPRGVRRTGRRAGIEPALVEAVRGHLRGAGQHDLASRVVGDARLLAWPRDIGAAYLSVSIQHDGAARVTIREAFTEGMIASVVFVRTEDGWIAVTG